MTDPTITVHIKSIQFNSEQVRIYAANHQRIIDAIPNSTRR